MTLPLQANPIGCMWFTDEGGFHVTAKTDSVGQAIIGISTLNHHGNPASNPTEYTNEHLMPRLVVGYDGCGKAISIYAKIEVTDRGLDVRVLVPPHLQTRKLKQCLFAAWNSEKNVPETPDYLIH